MGQLPNLLMPPAITIRTLGQRIRSLVSSSLLPASKTSRIGAIIQTDTDAGLSAPSVMACSCARSNTCEATSGDLYSPLLTMCTK
jgi:hypothetical protein